MRLGSGASRCCGRPFDLDFLGPRLPLDQGVIRRIEEIARLEISEVYGRADVEVVTRFLPHAPSPGVLCSSLCVDPRVLCERMVELAAAAVY